MILAQVLLQVQLLTVLSQYQCTSLVASLSHTITDRRLRLFGHIILSSTNEDHHRSVASAIQKPPLDWKRLKGRPSYHHHLHHHVL